MNFRTMAYALDSVVPMSHFSRQRTPETRSPLVAPAHSKQSVWVTGSRPRRHRSDIERLSALAARNDCLHGVVAGGVVENEERKASTEAGVGPAAGLTLR